MKDTDIAEKRLQNIYQELESFTEEQEYQFLSGMRMLVSYAEKAGYIKNCKND